MSIDFFKADCQYPPIRSVLFGLCDPQTGKKAYPDTDNHETWIATVKNDNENDVVFTAIDKCVLFDHEYPDRGRCDGMLTTDQHLYLVELKEQVPPWQSHAKEQLLSTIQFLLDTHDISQFKKRKAFACNKKRAAFVEIDNEENAKLFHETGFRLDIQAEVLIL